MIIPPKSRSVSGCTVCLCLEVKVASVKLVYGVSAWEESSPEITDCCARGGILHASRRQ